MIGATKLDDSNLDKEDSSVSNDDADSNEKSDIVTKSELNGKMVGYQAMGTTSNMDNFDK